MLQSIKASLGDAAKLENIAGAIFNRRYSYDTMKRVVTIFSMNLKFVIVSVKLTNKLKQ